MDTIVIHGGKTLNGAVAVSGAKNAALPALAAALMPGAPVHLSNIPNVRDVRVMCRLLTYLGATVVTEPEGFAVSSDQLTKIEAPYDLVRTMRASILLLGPLLVRMRHARVSKPGGCAIGNRPIDIHLKGLAQMGAEITLDHGMIDITADSLKGTEIYLDFPTVTGTENLMMAAAAADGTTVLYNAAQEPEIKDLADLLRSMGVEVTGAGSNTITISSNGNPRLTGCRHRVIPDRIEAGTFAMAAAVTGGTVELNSMNPDHLVAVFEKLSQAGVRFHKSGDRITIEAGSGLRGVDLQTAVYPGYPTDLQAQFMALMCTASGDSVITESIFENRFMHVAELNRMGADIVVRGRTAFVKGGIRFSGADVMATDLRASASLVIAGLAARNQTRILRVYHLDRGYERLVEKFQALGADIRRVGGGRP